MDPSGEPAGEEESRPPVAGQASSESGAFLANPSGRGRSVESLPPIDGVFETMLVRRRLSSPYLPLWDLHVDRLLDGAYRLGLELPHDTDRLLGEIRSQVFRIEGELRLRLVIGRERPGAASVVGFAWEAAPVVTAPHDPTALPLLVHPVDVDPRPELDEDSGLPLGRPKSTARAVYDQAAEAARAAGCADAVLVASPDDGGGGPVLETTIGNLFARIDGVLVTTPAHGQRVPGVGQRALLRELKTGPGPRLPVERREFSLADLRRADAIWVTNALRGPRRAELSAQSARADLGEDPLREAWQRLLV